MKVIRAFCLCWLLMLADGVSAQLVDKVLSVLGEDSVGSVTVARTDSDSIQLSLVRQELETARLNEANLRMEMEQMKLAGYAADSVKLALQKQRIDSLRTVTPGIPVVVEKDTLFYLYAKRGGHTPQQRAKDVSNVIEALGTRFNLRPDSVYLESTDIVTDLMYGEKVIISFTDQDALWENCTRDQLAASKRHVVVDKLKAMQKEHSLWQLGKRILYFILVLVGQFFLFKFTNWLFRKLKLRIQKLKDTKLKPISIQDYELLDTQKQVNLLVFVANLVRYVVMLLQLLLIGSVIILHFPSDQELGLYIILLHLESYKGHLEWNSRLYTQSVHYLCDMLCGEVSGQTGALSCQ